MRATDTSGNEDGNIIEVPSATVVSYIRSIQPIFDMNCTLSTCHFPPIGAGGLSLTTYALTAAGGINGPVFLPGNPEVSLLVRRTDEDIMAPDPPFIPPRMPNGLLRLPSRDILNIRAWIQQGAQNN